MNIEINKYYRFKHTDFAKHLSNYVFVTKIDELKQEIFYTWHDGQNAQASVHNFKEHFLPMTESEINELIIKDIIT